MADKRRFILAHAEARRRAVECIQRAPDGYVVEVREPKRNTSQNALLWVLLTAFADQREWPVNGRMTKMAPDDWKDVLSAAFRREQNRVAMGVDGGMVILGLRTSKLGKREFGEFLEFVQSVAAERGVSLESDEVSA